MSLRQKRISAFGPDRLIGTDLRLAMLGDGPAGLWLLDETSGTTANDTSGNNRHGTYAGTYSLNQTAIATGLTASTLFTNGRVTVPYGAWMDTAQYTVEALVYASALDGTRGLFTRDEETTYRLWAARFTGGAAAHLGWNVGGSLWTATGGSAIGTGTAMLIAFRWNADTTQLWVNGSVRSTNGPNVGNARTSTSIGMVFACGNTGGGYPWNGRMSHVAFYGSALSDSQLLAHARIAGLA